MSNYIKPEHITIGPLRQGVEARLTPHSDGKPTDLLLSGSRAYARFLAARELAENRYDHTSKQTYNRLDELLTKPFVTVQEELLRHLSLAGLQIKYDEQAVAKMEYARNRILAPYSRWYPVENEDGEIADWKLDEGGIKAEWKAETKAVLDYLGWNDTTQLFPFAYDGAQEILTKRDVLLSMSMGTGKTRLALCLALCWAHMDNTQDTPIVIFANKRHTGAWEEELGGVAESRPCELITREYGKGCYETWYEKADFKKLTFKKRFLIVSLDRAKLLDEKELSTLLKLCRNTSAILDESYIASNPSTQLTRFLHKVQGLHHIALTGTPIKSFVSQLASILVWVHRGGSIALPDYPLGRDGTYKKWNEKFMSYATAEDGGRKKTPFIKNESEFWEMMAPLMYRRLRNEPEVVAALGEAEIQKIERRVELSEQHMATYKGVVKQFTDWYVREVEARRARGESASIPEQDILIKIGYQVNNVRAPWRMADHSDEDFQWPAHPREMTSVHKEALQIIEDEVGEQNRNVIVFGVSKDAMELLTDEIAKAGYSCALINGDVSHKERKEIIARCRRGEIQVLLGSFGTLAEGINLSFAQTAIVIDTDWNPSGLAQALARITRGIQLGQPRAYLIQAAGTIQEYMIRMSQLKSAAIARGLDRRGMQVGAEDIPDIQAYVQSLVQVGDPEEVAERVFFMEEEAVVA